MPRYYVYVSEGKARTTTRRPSTFPFIYVGEDYFTFAPSKGIQVRCRSIEELEYFLLAHELMSASDERRMAFHSLRRWLEVMKSKKIAPRRAAPDQTKNSQK